MEILKKLKFSRRHALRGMVGGIGVSLSLPVLEIMCNNSGTAFAQGAPLPTTFGIFFWGNGIHPGSLWTPSGTGDGNAWQLPPNLQDFANLKDYMTLVTGLDMMDAQFKGHGWGVVYVLAGGDGTMCNTTGDISRSPVRRTTRNVQRDSVAAHNRSARRERHSHRRAIQVARDRHPEVRGHQHGHREPESRPHRPEPAFAAGTRSREAIQHLVRHGHANGVADRDLQSASPQRIGRGPQ